MTAQAPQQRKTSVVQEPPPVRQFIQITSGQPFGQGLTLFALDEAGDVWQLIPGREPDVWQPLSRKRGRLASR